MIFGKQARLATFHQHTVLAIPRDRLVFLPALLGSFLVCRNMIRIDCETASTNQRQETQSGRIPVVSSPVYSHTCRTALSAGLGVSFSVIPFFVLTLPTTVRFSTCSSATKRVRNSQNGIPEDRATSADHQIWHAKDRSSSGRSIEISVVAWTLTRRG